MKKMDFNGDGTDDILLRRNGDYDQTYTADWIMRDSQYVVGHTLTTPVSMKNQLPIAYVYYVVAKGDFNDDGTTDILLRDPFYSDPFVEVQINNGLVSSYTKLDSSLIESGYVPVGAGDINGDGTDDVVLSDYRGDVAAFIMKDGAITSVNMINTVPATGYHVVGMGDFNGDGTSDILLQAGNGSVVAWFMRDGAYQSGSVIGDAAGFTAESVGDFNGDGTDDLLLQKGNTVVDWLIKNGAYQSGNMLATDAAVYAVTATPDLNGDGTSDIVTQSGGTITGWTMKDGQVQSTAVIGVKVDGYTVV